MGLLNALGVTPEAGGLLGLLGNVGNSLNKNSNMLMGFAGDGPAGAIKGAQIDLLAEKERREQEDKQKQIAAYQKWAESSGLGPEASGLMAADPALGRAIAAGRLSPSMTDDIKEFQYAKKDGGFSGSFTDFLQLKHRNRAGGGFGLTPIYGEDPNGNTSILQLGSDGSVNAPKLPEGFKVSSGIEKIDQGDRWAIVNKRTGETVGYQPKNLANAAAQKEIGKAQGQAEVQAPGQIAAADTALGIIDQIKHHPGREGATGWQSAFPTFNGSEAANFENLVEQAKGGAFLTAIQQMRGLGALSEAEGKAATQAVARMRVADSDAGFLKAVDDYEAIVRRGSERAARINAGGSVTAPYPGGSPGGSGSGRGGSTSGQTRSGVTWQAR